MTGERSDDPEAESTFEDGVQQLVLNYGLASRTMSTACRHPLRTPVDHFGAL